MSRVLELEEQIKKLQEEKSKIYAEERKATLQEIKGKITLFGFSARELGIKLASGDMPDKKAKGTAKKVAKKAGKLTFKSSGIYFDLDGVKILAGRGRPSKQVTAFAADRGVTPDSLKRNADGTPFTK